MMQDFFGNTIAEGDYVITSFNSLWGNNDVFEYCIIKRFTKTQVIVDRPGIKRQQFKEKRLFSNQLIKVDPAQYTLYILRNKNKETT
jgi:hypothetical protein